MVSKIGTLPLTPAMRAALLDRTTGTARRSILLILVIIFLIVGLFWMIYRGQPGDYDSAMWFVSVFALVLGGIALIGIGIHKARQERASARALRIGTFYHFDGGFRYFRIDAQEAPSRYYLRLRDFTMELDDNGTLDFVRLQETVGGTALCVPEAEYLLIAWDRDGTLLYAAPDYDLDADPDAPRPSGVPTPDRSSARRITLTGRVTALLNPLARSVVAMIALGVALLALALYVAAPWTLLT